MFEVIVCKDKIPIPYHHMELENTSSLMTVDPKVVAQIITCKYNDRVIPNVGLLIDLYDIVQATEVKTIPDVPVPYATVAFRYIVFNPPIGSVWIGHILSSNEEGIYVTLSFFKDIFIPYQFLPPGSFFSSSDNEWAWSSEGEDETSEPLLFISGMKVRFAVRRVIYHEKESEGPLMEVYGAMDTPGLGPTYWWRSDDMEESLPPMSSQSIEEEMQPITEPKAMESQ